MKNYLFPKDKSLHILYFSALFVFNHFFQIVTPKTQSIANPAFWILNFIGALTFCTLLYFGIFKFFAWRYPGIKSSVAAACLVLPFFFFQDFFLTLEGAMVAGLRARWILPLCAVLVLIVLFRILRSNRTFYTVNQFLNILSLSLLTYAVLNLLLSFPAMKPKVLDFTPSTKTVSCESCPNIYFLLLDSYTSNKSLEQYFNFSNKKFVSSLERLNFQVADQATSAHNRTSYSLSATMNFNAIDSLENYGLIGNALLESSVVKSLQAKGYDFYNYSIFDMTGQKPFYTMSFTFPIKFVTGIFESSLFNMLFSDIWLKLNLYDIHQEVLMQTILQSEKKAARPRFVYSHLLAPHPPFVIDSTGSKIGFFNQRRNIANPEAYVDQIKGLNDLIVKTAARIVENDPEAILVIMGDHGYRYLSIPEAEHESFTVFLAYRTNRPTSNDQVLLKSNDIFTVVFDALKSY